MAEAKVQGQGNAIRRSDQRLPEPMSGKVLVKTVGRTCLGVACVLGGGQTGKGVQEGERGAENTKGERILHASMPGVRAAGGAGWSIYQHVFITGSRSHKLHVKTCLPLMAAWYTVARKGDQPRHPPAHE